MNRRFREWFSIRLAKNPGQIVLLAILFFNVVFLILAALIISRMSLTGTEHLGFLQAAYYTVTMILDAGCVSFVVEDIGPQNAIIAIVCLIIIIVGMISFTGAVIGYVTNYISGFIENSNSGNYRLYMSEHFVILNWNSRALEIVNDLLYSESFRKIVVLVNSDKDEVKRQIDERIHETVKRENIKIREISKKKPYLIGRFYYYSHKFRNNMSIIVREGDVFSSKQLYDISLHRAAAVVILGEEISSSDCKYLFNERRDQCGNGNSITIKTLMQVSDITSAYFSADNQRIIVEITDDWTWDLVQKIIRCKQVDGKCNIVPVRVNQILGQLMAQFSLMPELNTVYNELLSNKGATFFTAVTDISNENQFIEQTLSANSHVIPLTVQTINDHSHCYYMACEGQDIGKTDNVKHESVSLDINRNYWVEKKKIIILGHNSKCREIMDGFTSFTNEWGYKDSDESLLSIIVIDDEKHLEKMDYYKDYPFVIKTVAAELFDKDTICRSINDFLAVDEEDVSVLILSDDLVPSDEIDADTLANLVYVQDIINDKKEANPDFDVEIIDVIAEINDPKHHDVVSSYSVKNVVISNRYISKMITQIGEKDSIYDFYQDILTYDDGSAGEDVYESKEIYIKKVRDFFNDLPKECTASQLIRGVYNATYDPSLPPEQQNVSIIIGYVKKESDVVLFSGNQQDLKVKLESRDKIVVFSNH